MLLWLAYRLLVVGYVMGWTIQLFLQLPNLSQHPALAYFTQWAYLVLLFHLLVALLVTVYHLVKQNKQYVTAFTPVPSAGETPEDTRSPSEAMSTDASPQAVLPHVSSAVLMTSLPSRYLYRMDHHGEDGAHDLPWHLKCSWIIFNMAAVSAIVVTSLYLSVMYPMMAAMNEGYTANGLEINLHLINTLIVLLECILSALPVRIYHCIFSIMFGGTYVIFTLIYWAVDHKNHVIYPTVLDWNCFGLTAAILAGVLLIGLPLFQLILYGLYRSRLGLFNLFIKCKENTRDEHQDTTC